MSDAALGPDGRDRERHAGPVLSGALGDRGAADEFERGFLTDPSGLEHGVVERLPARARDPIGEPYAALDGRACFQRHSHVTMRPRNRAGSLARLIECADLVVEVARRGACGAQILPDLLQPLADRVPGAGPFVDVERRGLR